MSDGSDQPVRGGVVAELRLCSTTPDGWAEVVAGDPLALLSDHAHCELKAAASAMTMLKQNPERPGLALRLAPLIKEESEHLHRVLREIEVRGGELKADLPNPYAEGLRRIARETRPGPPRGSGFLDVVLVSALIEMRSHERFERLAECAALAGLDGLYRGLGEAEARHGVLFADIARTSFPEGEVVARFAELALREAELLETLPTGPRIHSGHGSR